MERQRSFYDSDQIEQLAQPTRFKTELNKNEVYCGMCGEVFFLDDVRFKSINRVIENTLENPFLCEECEFENDENLIH